MTPDADVGPFATGRAFGDGSVGPLWGPQEPFGGLSPEGQRDEPIGAARRAKDQALHVDTRRTVRRFARRPLLDLPPRAGQLGDLACEAVVLNISDDLMGRAHDLGVDRAH